MIQVKNTKLNGFYRGKVLDTADPEKLGRIKICIYPDFDGIDVEYLPWAVPAMSVFDGAGSGTGSFCVPKVGSFVFCFFENGDVYQPVYFAEAQTGVHGLPSERITNYPNRKVLKTAKTTITIDSSSGDIIIEGSGNISINGSSINLNT